MPLVIEQQVDLYDGAKSDIPDGWNDNRVSDYSVVTFFKQDIIDAEDDLNNQIKNTSTIDEIENIDISEDNIKAKAGY